MTRFAVFAVLMLAAAAVLPVRGVCLEGAAPAQKPEFTAILVSEDKTGKAENKIYFTREKQRLEMPGSDFQAIIIRMDKGVVWTLIPSKKLFLELPVRPENKNPLIYEPDKVLKREQKGKETVSGHPAIKERVVFQTDDGRVMDIYRWFATDLRWPIKAEAANGSWKLRFKDIRPGRQAPALFELPRDYKKIMMRRTKPRL